MQVLTNGSFEEGQITPTGWHPRAAGKWETGDARRGERFLSGRSARGGVVWQTDLIAVQPQTDYRLEGWVRCADGRTRIGVDLFDARAQRLPSAHTPLIRRADGWQYVAVEWNSERAAAARVWFWVKGQADLDDVSLAPAALSFIGNRSVELDDRGRLGLWTEEKHDRLLPGRRAGQHASDPGMARTGKASVRLTPAGDWYAIATVNYGVPAWADTLELSGWARGDALASAQILACWMDDRQTVLRVDTGATVRGVDWRLVSLAPPAPPTNAATVRLGAVARGGQVWFDDFEMRWLRPRRRVVRVFVNQVGYELTGPKTAVVAMNFFPRDASCRISLLTPKGATAWEGKLPCAGRIHSGTPDDWGWYFWRADFSSLRRTGTYRAVAKAEGAREQSFPFKVGRGVLLAETASNAVDFFFIQRCGFAVPGWHEACHLDDAKLPDGTHIDAVGGWHSAGDYNKLIYENGDGGVVFALLSAYQAAPELLDRQDRDRDGLPNILDEARWGAQFVAKMQMPESGGLRNHLSQGPGRAWTKWSAPEVHTDNLIGTDDDPVIQTGEGNSPLVIGGWARLSALLRQRGIENDFLDHARRLWNHATKQGTQVGSPHLLLSALELHRVTGERASLDYARGSVESLLAQQATSGRLRGAFGSYGELTAGALAQFALSHTNDSIGPRIKQALRAYTDFCMSTADNAFGLSKLSVGQAEAFFPSDLGNNFQRLMRAWAAGLVYRLTGDGRALQFAGAMLTGCWARIPMAFACSRAKAFSIRRGIIIATT
jgi:hypothetical protein